MGAVVVLGVLAITGRANGPRFYPDDPIWQDDDRALDASGAKEIAASDYYDFIENTFFTPGDDRLIPAVNVNTVDEVPDSAWFTNRIGRRPMSLDEIVRGPDRVETLSIDGWLVVRGKDEGLQPGYRVADPAGHLYQIEFDPISNPEMATGAEIVGTAFYHAFGYNVVDVYLVEVDPEKVQVSPQATIRDLGGRRRRYTRADVDDVLRQVARQPNGRYRALASRFADGAPLGSFRYYGTRPDDPNDIHPHEHRRELRGNRVFAAWLNHDDSRGLNSLDMLETTPPSDVASGSSRTSPPAAARKWVKHYMFDFGSIMGSGTAFAQTPRSGNEYILDWRSGFLTLGTLGLYLRPWLLIDYPHVPSSVGRFEPEAFDPEAWKPEYPNPAFRNMRPEDAFWAARIVARFTDDMIAAIVRKAQYSDARATEYITKVLIGRRDKVLRTWLTAVNPLVDFRLDDDGRLTFENAAVHARVADPPTEYRVAWSRFDNGAKTHEAVGEEEAIREPSIRAPRTLLASAGYICAAVRSIDPSHRSWQRPVRAYFHHVGDARRLVGLEREPDLNLTTRQ